MNVCYLYFWEHNVTYIQTTNPTRTCMFVYTYMCIYIYIYICMTLAHDANLVFWFKLGMKLLTWHSLCMLHVGMTNIQNTMDMCVNITCRTHGSGNVVLASVLATFCHAWIICIINMLKIHKTFVHTWNDRLVAHYRNVVMALVLTTFWHAWIILIIHLLKIRWKGV